MLWLLCAALAYTAHANTPLRVLFLCTPHVACETFNKRVKGQTSDLPVQLHSAAFPPTHNSNQLDDVAAADQVAARQQADVVLWWREGSLVALTRKPAPGRVLVRPIAGTTTLGTAHLEAGSLVARTTIVATLNNAPLGIARPPVAEPAGKMVTAHPVAAPDTKWQLAPRLGWATAWDGLPKEPTFGVEGALEARWRALAVGALWLERPTVHLFVPEARGSIGSRKQAVLLAYDFFDTRAWSLGVQGRLGWLTTWLQPLSGPMLDELRFVRRFAGVGVRLRRTLLRGRAAAFIAGNIDRVQDPINVGLRDPSGYRPLWYMWATQPSICAGIELTFRR